VPLDQKRIVQVPRDHTSFSLYHISQFVHDVDSSPTRSSRWLDDPIVESQRPVPRLDLAIAHQHLVFDNVFLIAEALAKLLPLLWKTESFRQEVKVLLRETFLHLYDIDGQSVFPCELLTRREVIDLLIVIESFVKVVFALSVRPQHVPVVSVSRHQPIYFK